MSSKNKTPIELRADEILRQLDEGEAVVLPRAGETVIGNWLNIFTQRHEDETLADALSKALSS